jgi:hypothetical protein
MSSVVANLTKLSNYLKIRYGKAGIVMYNYKYPTVAFLPKEYGWTGGNFEEPIDLSIGVGVGSGDTLPDAAVESIQKVSFSDKNMYARTRLSRKAMKKLKAGDSGFVDAMKDRWQKLQRGWVWNIERALWANVNGSLGQINTLVTNSDPTFVVDFTAAQWKVYNWEVGILVNVHTGTDLFEVTAVSPSNRRVTLVRQAGTQIPAASQEVYMQNSKDNDIISIPEVLEATTGSKYGITIGYLWQAGQNLSVSQTIDEELIDNEQLEREAETGEAPNTIHTSIKQWKILKAGNTNLKRYRVENPNVPKKYAAQLGFTAIEYLSPTNSNAIPILYNRFVDDDSMYGINSGWAKIKHCEEPQFFDEDGTVFLRTPDNKPDYEARYGAYMELYMYPTKHWAITGLS